KKFNETYPNGMKRTTFIVRLSNSTNLKYCEDLDETDLDQNNERENTINNNFIVLITIPSIIDVGFLLTKGWVLKSSQKLDNRDGTRIKQDVRAMLE
ncbi:20660_t:CDS:2, partial [Racocetra persica]